MSARKTSARPVRANRENAKKSTGPKTAEGKKRASRNAVRHGIFCNAAILPGEDRSEFDQFRAALIEEHKPQSVTELFFVERIASAMWRMKRLSEAEAHAHEEYRWDEKEQECFRTQNWDNWETDEIDPESPAQTTYGLLKPKEGRLSILERFSLYEKRLEGTIHRCIRDLRKLRTPMKGEVVPETEAEFAPAKEVKPQQPEEVKAQEPSAASVTEMRNEANDANAEGGMRNAEGKEASCELGVASCELEENAPSRSRLVGEQPATCNVQQATCNKQPTTDHQQPLQKSDGALGYAQELPPRSAAKGIATWR